jgi:hypothetical protein
VSSGVGWGPCNLDGRFLGNKLIFGLDSGDKLTRPNINLFPRIYKLHVLHSSVVLISSAHSLNNEALFDNCLGELLFTGITVTHDIVDHFEFGFQMSACVFTFLPLTSKCYERV